MQGIAIKPNVTLHTTPCDQGFAAKPSACQPSRVCLQNGLLSQQSTRAGSGTVNQGRQRGQATEAQAVANRPTKRQPAGPPPPTCCWYGLPANSEPTQKDSSRGDSSSSCFGLVMSCAGGWLVQQHRLRDRQGDSSSTCFGLVMSCVGRWPEQ